MDVRVNGAWMGATARADRTGRFELVAEILGSAEIATVELVVNGAVGRRYTPGRQHVHLADFVPLMDAPQVAAPYCYLRAAQRDGQRAWSSPIWLRGANGRMLRSARHDTPARSDPGERTLPGTPL
jgi:hypothetical protein